MSNSFAGHSTSKGKMSGHLQIPDKNKKSGKRPLSEAEKIIIRLRKEDREVFCAQSKKMKLSSDARSLYVQEMLDKLEARPIDVESLIAEAQAEGLSSEALFLRVREMRDEANFKSSCLSEE